MDLATDHWYNIGTGSKISEYEYVQRAEGYLETGYDTISANDPLYLLNVLALMSLAFGVKNVKEIFVGAVGFVPHWYLGGDGFDGMISALSGVFLYKRRWTYVAFPLLLEALRTMKDFTKGKQITKLALSRSGTFLAGYLIAMSRMV